MQPPGFQDPKFPHIVYRVEKAMYGLHQAPRAWYDDNVADLLTKAFDVGRFQYLVGKGTSKIKVFIEYSWSVLDCPHWVVTQRTLQMGKTWIQWRITSGTIRISQSKVPSLGTYETAFPIGDVRYREFFSTDTSLDVGQDRENIAKTSAMTHEALPMVTSLSGGKGSMQQKLQELMDICTSLQRQHSLMEESVQSQDLEITQLKAKVKTLKDNERKRDKFGTLGAANILASRGLRSVFTTASLSVATASTGVSPVVATTSVSFPTAVIFTTVSVATPTTRVTRSLRGIVIGSSSLIYVNILSISKKDKGKWKM
nr:retrotransposon protein, putative, Ty1-copia subclass [Tanacetum cinerariifolium]